MKRFGCVGSCALLKNGFYNRKVHIIRKVDFATKYTRACLFFDCLLHLRYTSIFSELGHMLPHPTHDSAKSSPNVRLSCPTQYCLHRCSQLVFFSPCETLDQPVYRVTFCSPESTPDAGIFFFGGHQNYPNNTFFFLTSFCIQLTPQSTTVSRFLLQMDVPSHGLLPPTHSARTGGPDPIGRSEPLLSTPGDSDALTESALPSSESSAPCENPSTGQGTPRRSVCCELF